MLRHIWTCKCCGKQQSGLPLDFFSSAPTPWHSLPEDQRNAPGNRLDEDLCMIGNTEYFVRGCVEIPIVDHDETFVWGLWTSVTEDNFKRVLDLWAADVENEPPMSGQLCNNVTFYPPTIGLSTSIRLRNNNQRPKITLEPTDHPFAVDQRKGVTLAKVKEIVAMLSPRH